MRELRGENSQRCSAVRVDHAVSHANSWNVAHDKYKKSIDRIEIGGYITMWRPVKLFFLTLTFTSHLEPFTEIFTVRVKGSVRLYPPGARLLLSSSAADKAVSGQLIIHLPSFTYGTCE